MTTSINNKLRKYLAATLGVIMAVSLVSCGKSADGSDLSRTESAVIETDESVIITDESVSEDTSTNTSSKDSSIISKTTTTKKSVNDNKTTATKNGAATTKTTTKNNGTTVSKNQQPQTYTYYDEPTYTQAPQTQATQHTDPPMTTTQKPVTTQKPQTTTTQAPETAETTATTPAPPTQANWIDDLSDLERAYYNFGTNKNFTDSDWDLIYDDLCARAMSFDGKQDVYISPGGCIVYDDCQWEPKKVHFPGVLHITINPELYCSHEIGENGAPTDWNGGFLPGASIHTDSDLYEINDITSYKDVLWWMEECRAVIDNTILCDTGYLYYYWEGDEDYEWHSKYGHDVDINPDWTQGKDNIGYFNWLIVLY